MGTLTQIKVPDIGDFKDVEVIEVLVAPGAQIRAEDALVTLESDKATMEVPSPGAGVVREIALAPGDRVSQGSLILTLEEGEDAETQAAGAGRASPDSDAGENRMATPAASPQGPAAGIPAPAPAAGGPPHASPSVRRLGRERGVDLRGVTGSGPKGRILREDVESLARGAGARAGGDAAVGDAAGPSTGAQETGFSRFGPVETQPLTRIQKLSGANLHRTWTGIPHVTHHDLADITELEAFRQSLQAERGPEAARITLPSFLLKAAAAALGAFPTFNASLAPDGENLILKRYCHIGVAVDTPEGLMVPVIRDVDKKGVLALAEELAAVSAKARAKRIAPEDLQGGCFTLSSLGGIGGTGFTPILNAPEVAILGAARASWQPVYEEGEFRPRLMLPLSLSYDHRVIDGAHGARFTAFLGSLLADIRRLLL
uniref:Dihydrolipoamide acetyltransferase component of pyruvate dehydrogenase complex n=1 Tax=Candidatus Kentrum sp. DK TaxID=2126562 RepID=A0A450S3U8_9GAMM|nr:MAG: pyruvate dehydrogenase E2 component (dihydrolipoamide acetyltransferase) [Candidatus Kentron sp. DK]